MSVCRVCGEQGHLASKCKDLHAPDSETLYQGEGCSGGHGGDDDPVHTVFLDERGRIWSLGDNHHGNTHSHPTVALDGVQCCFDTYGRGG